MVLCRPHPEAPQTLLSRIVITSISVDLELDFAIEQQLGPWLSYVHYLEGRMAVSLTGFLTLHLDLNAMHERAVPACDGKFEFVHLSTEVGGIYSDLRLAGTVKTLVQGIAPLFAQEVAPMLCRGDLACWLDSRMNGCVFGRARHLSLFGHDRVGACH